MNRLTFKNEANNIVSFDTLACLRKLYTLEDIEEELGISLPILFKALKDGILLNNMKIWLPRCQLTYMVVDNEYAFIYDYYLIKLKDYGKSWYLKEDLKSE